MKLRVITRKPVSLVHKVRLPYEPFEVSEEMGAALLTQYPTWLQVFAAGEWRGPNVEMFVENDVAIAPPVAGIEVLGLSTRTETALLNEAVNTVDQLRALDVDALRSLPGIGPKAVEEIARALEVGDGQ